MGKFKFFFLLLQIDSTLFWLKTFKNIRFKSRKLCWFIIFYKNSARVSIFRHRGKGCFSVSNSSFLGVERCVAYRGKKQLLQAVDILGFMKIPEQLCFVSNVELYS